jgi:hypothetical protein
MAPQQREYCKAKAGLPFVVDYILGNNHPTVKWFCDPANVAWITPDLVTWSRRQWDSAERAVARDPERLVNVRNDRKVIDSWAT